MSTPHHMLASRHMLASLGRLIAEEPAPLAAIAALLAAETGATCCSIHLQRPDGRQELAASEGPCPQILAADPDVALPPGSLHLPVRRSGRVLGTLVLYRPQEAPFEIAEREALALAALLIAPTLASATPRAPEPAVTPGGLRRFAGRTLVAGLVIGPAVLPGLPAPRRLTADDPEAERDRLHQAMAAMRHDLDALIDDGLDAPRAGGGHIGGEVREVLEAYRMIAADPAWLRRITEAIATGLSAEAAVHRIAGELRERMRRIADPYLRERTADLEDLSGRLLAALAGTEDPHAPSQPPLPMSETGAPERGTILLARRLGPAELLAWHTRGLAGLVVEEASLFGHAAIVARALGIPTISGVHGLIEAAEPGDEVVLDAAEGSAGLAQVVLRPGPDLLQIYGRAMGAAQQRQANLAELRTRPALSRDGVAVRLMLNIGLPLELGQLAATGAEGIGLFRTEIAMMARGAEAEAAEQAAIYGQVLDVAGDRPVLFRTLDLGGDKLLAEGEAPEEENPAMGWRSLRVGLDRPSLMRRQLRALLLAASGRPLSVMFPMVATLAEFRAARALLLAEAARVRPQPQTLRIGTMLEVPSLLWQFDALLTEADFVSIGTNDLLQFLYAADRTNPALAARYDLLSPAMLALIGDVAGRAGAAGVPLSVCGEAAGRPIEALTLIGLGVTSLSMPAPAVLPLKAALGALDVNDFSVFLAALYRDKNDTASLRGAIADWLRERNVPV